jgi:Tfp pilus assembly protein PilV
MQHARERISKNMKGQTLLEALIALSAIALVISGISVTIVNSLNNAGYGKTQAVATQYAQEGLDVVRRMREGDYATFSGYSGSYCLSKGANMLTAIGTCQQSPNVDSYIRIVSIEQNPGCGVDIRKVTVSVSWTDGRCTAGSFCHSSKLVSCVSAVSQIQAP